MPSPSADRGLWPSDPRTNGSRRPTWLRLPSSSSGRVIGGCPHVARLPLSRPKELQMSSRTNNLGIVVGVDGSPSSKVAVYWATRDAALRNVPLTLVNVVSPILADWRPAPAPVAIERWQKEQAIGFVADARRVAEEHRPDCRPVQIN